MRFWEIACKIACKVIKVAVRIFVIGAIVWLFGLVAALWLL